MITNRATWFLEKNQVLPPSQAGFRQRRSTMDHLTKLESNVKMSFHEKMSTVAIFLDIPKAYDMVWTRGLHYKMAKIGFSGRLLSWFESFLSGRSFQVTVGNALSAPCPTENGVPQGSVVSPLLFNIMLYDFSIPTTGVKSLLYADDIAVYASVKYPIQAEAVIHI